MSDLETKLKECEKKNRDLMDELAKQKDDAFYYMGKSSRLEEATMRLQDRLDKCEGKHGR